MAPRFLGTDGFSAAGGIRVRLEPVELNRLGLAWQELEPRSEPSFFRSWGWIGCWLRHLPADRQAFTATAIRGDQVVGLGVFLARREWRHGVVPVASLGLHESGDPALDSLHIEHNGLLAERSHAPAVWQAMLGLLAWRGTWDELILGGLERGTVELCIEAAGAQQCRVVVRQRTRSAHLDLAQLRRSGRGLAYALSRDTRHQLTRARRLYEAIGPVTLRSAQTADEALAMLEQLKELHQSSWRRRGRPGCFAAPVFETFHRDLIGDRFRHGEIRLLRVAAGTRPIGYLYNFAYDDRIYAYQSGFDYTADGRLKPGLVSHALAIEQATREGFAVYDFMAGENRLKESFASHWSEMVWLSVQRPSAVSWLERQLAAVRSRVAGAGPPRPPRSPGGADPSLRRSI
jgi:CelD/BcsL family acetyltransferase involved in cellulose biosynthesis